MVNNSFKNVMYTIEITNITSGFIYLFCLTQRRDTQIMVQVQPPLLLASFKVLLNS